MSPSPRPAAQPASSARPASASARTGADVLLQALAAAGCKHLFGLPGTTVAPLLDRLLAHPGIEYVLTKHESVAVAMAEGYARVTRAPAFASVYMAVGLANAVSMLYNAHKSRVPLVLLASQQDLALRLGTETVVDGDQLHLVHGIVRYAAEVVRADRLEEHFVRAWKQASGPLVPGPSFLSVPSDVLSAETSVPPLPLDGFRVPLGVEAPAARWEEAAGLLARAERPVIIAGSQVASFEGVSELVELSEAFQLPVSYEYFFNDRLGFPRQHGCCIGPFRSESPWLAHADVVLALGCRLHHELNVPARPRLPTSARVIQVNVEPEQLALKHPAELALLSDPSSAARALRAALLRCADASLQARVEARRTALLEHSRRERDRLDVCAQARWNDWPLSPWRVVRELDEVADGRARVVVELSSNTNCFYEFSRLSRPELVHASSGCALGWAIAAAAGMKLGDPSTPTLACVGDGAFLFGVQTLWTLANYDIPVVVVVFNNGGYYSTRLFTERLGGLSADSGCYAGGDMPGDPTDCARIAAGFGVGGERVTAPSDLSAALRRGLAAQRPYVIDVPVTREFVALV